jgi:hypothetical protein
MAMKKSPDVAGTNSEQQSIYKLSTKQDKVCFCTIFNSSSLVAGVMTDNWFLFDPSELLQLKHQKAPRKFHYKA